MAWKGENWTHSGIVTQVGGDTVTVYEALLDGFTKSLYSREKLGRLYMSGMVSRGRPVDGVDMGVLRDVAERFLSRPYGFQDIVNILYPSVVENTGARKLFCSEAVSRLLEEATMGRVSAPSELGKIHDLVEPVDLVRLTGIDWRRCM